MAEGQTDNSAMYSALISAGTETANMVMASSGSKKARQHSSEENQKARDWNRQQWLDNNAYNERVTDPKYKMQRLKDAGINPHLAYSNGSDFANPTANAPAQGGGFQTPTVPQPMQINTQAMNQAVQNSLLTQAQIDNINADTKNKLSNAGNTDIIAGINQANLDNTITQIAQENKLRDVQIAGGIAQKDLTEEQVKKTAMEIINLVKQNDKMHQEIDLMFSQKQLTDQQKTNAVAQLSVIWATKKNLDANTKLTGEKTITEKFNQSNIHQDTMNKGELHKSYQRGNYVGEQTDLGTSRAKQAESEANARKAVQLVIGAEKDNQYKGLKITEQEYINTIRMFETVDAGFNTLNPYNKFKSGDTETTTTTSGSSSTTDRYNGSGEYQGHSTTHSAPRNTTTNRRTR